MSTKLKQIRVDGYKNLINCVVNLGDFNVLVGPNNSGKSNLLEAIQMLSSVLAGPDSTKEKICNDGLTPPSRNTTWVCHLDEFKQKPLTIEMVLEVSLDNKKWEVEYGIVIESKWNGHDGGITQEYLKAKASSKTGKAKTYFSREGGFLFVGKKSHPISKHSSSFITLMTLYINPKKRSEILKQSTFFISQVLLLSLSPVFAIWPEGLRKACEKEEAVLDDSHTTFFNPLIALDDIKEKNQNNFNILKDVFCDILNFEDLEFTAGYLGKEKEGENRKRFRECRIKRDGSPAVDIAEYSDGTFSVLGILTAYFSPKRKGPLFLLEELENCLHPKALEKMLRFFQDNAQERPVLLTTHSPYLINGVNPSDLIISTVNEDGSVSFQKIEDRKKINAILNNKYLSFGDLMPDNFSEALKEK